MTTSRKITRGITLALALSAGGSVLALSGNAVGDSALRATLVDQSGAKVGKATLSFERDRSEVEVRLDLPPSMAGFHGFHIHSVGQCTPPFTTAGAHLGEDPADPAHRHRNHAGDLPVLLVDQTGRAGARFSTDRINVADLLDDDGSAFIVHAAPDNYANVPASDPVTGALRYSNANAVVPPVYPNTVTDATTLATGDAGGRVVCGVIG